MNENTRKVANEFSRLMRVELSDEDIRIVNDRNKHEYDESTCATHDFCDANMVMDEAFRNVMGYSPLDRPTGSAEWKEAMLLVDAAWAAARDHRFNQF